MSNVHGGCGKGGKGEPVGKTGSSAADAQFMKIGRTVRGGSGGSGGRAGSYGGHGSVYKSAAARLSCGRNPSDSMESIPELTFTASFEACGGGGDYTRSVTYTYTKELKTLAPDIKKLPTMEGKTFIGYYTQPNQQGVMYVDGSGSWVRDLTQLADLPLYAAWGSAGVCNITFSKGAGNGGENGREVELGERRLPKLSGDPAIPTYDGHIFGGYFTEQDGQGVQVFTSKGDCVGAWYATENIVTLYAYWIEAKTVYTSVTKHQTLTGDSVYRISGSVSGDTGCDALTVPGNKTVYICVDSGASFSAQGGNGSGTTAGGAGINLPSSSTLVVFGGGTLYATGGNAGNGGKGGNGADGRTSVNHDFQRGGKGGTSGAGGGGAGAGIGGSGGDGGAGKSGPDGPYTDPCVCKNSCKDGNAGYAGNDGTSGGTAGVLYALGNVKITATGGANGSGGGAGGQGARETSNGSGWSYSYTSAGGGGGGGGGGGCAAKAIGGGGGGGGGGGSGGSGGTTGRVTSRGFKAPYGQGGFGGAGEANGKQGTPAEKDRCSKNGPNEDIDVWAGAGGAGGSAGSTPDDGTVYVRSTATVSGGSQTAYAEAGSPLQRTLTFYSCGGTGGTTSQSVNFEAGFDLKGDDIVIPVKEGCDFGGYYTEQYGLGTQHVDSNGVWSAGYSTVGSRLLYARWTAPFSVSKNRDGGTVTGDGPQTLGLITTLSAEPYAGWLFSGWDDGIDLTNREVLVQGPETYVANFEIDFESLHWTGYDKDAYVAFTTDAEAAEAGYVARGGRIYYKTLAAAFANAPDGERIELIANVSEAGLFAFGVAKRRMLDGHGYTIAATGGNGAFDVLANTSLVLSNATVTGGMTVRVDARLGLAGVCTIDALELERDVRIAVLGDLTGSAIGVRAADDVITAGFDSGDAAIFTQLDGAGVGVNKSGEAEIGWYTGTGTETDPYGVLDAVFDASVSNILADAGSGAVKSSYLKMPVAGLVSATAGLAFKMPDAQKLVFVLQGDLPAGENALFGPLAPGFELSAFSLMGTKAGKLYTLGTNTAGVVTLTVVEPMEELRIDGDAPAVLNSYTGNKNLIKIGAGELVLEGSIDHTGYTIVSNGTLTLEGTMPNSSSVTVVSNAVLRLGSDSAIANGVTVKRGATLTFTDVATVANDVTLADGSTLLFAPRGSIVTSEAGANIHYGTPVNLTLCIGYSNGVYRLIEKLPDGVGVDRFAVAGLDETKNYTLAKDEDGVLSVTIATKALETVANMTDAEGNPVGLPMDVSAAWMSTNLPSYVGPLSFSNEVNAELNVRAPNDMTYWQNYVLNADPSDPTAKGFAVAQTSAPAASNPTNVYLKVTPRDLRSDTKVAVRYRLDEVLDDGEIVAEGALQETDVIALPVSDVTTATGMLFTVRGQFVDKDVPTTKSDETIAEGTVYGVIRVTETNRFQTIATPFLDMNSTEDVGTRVSALIQTATLTPGDKLYAYGADGAYKVFVLNPDGKTWSAVPVLLASSGGAKKLAAAAPTFAATSFAEEMTTQRGMGAYLERNDPTKPFTLVGRYAATMPDVTVEKGTAETPRYTLLGAPSVTAYDLNGVTGAGEGDQIVVPGEVPKVFTYEGGAWGYHKSVETTVTFGGQSVKAVKSVWTTDESMIPPGTGFIFVNKSGNEIKVR